MACGRTNGCAVVRKTFAGGLSLGWGLFNLIEGIIDHHILHIHHVTETANPLTWDLAFLGSGVLLIIVGLLAIQNPQVMIDSLAEIDYSRRRCSRPKPETVHKLFRRCSTVVVLQRF